MANPLVETSSAPSQLTSAQLPAADATMGELSEFAHTFNGYEFAGSLEACAAIHSRVRMAYEAELLNEHELDDLRTALFFVFRADRHMGMGMDGATEAFVRALVEQIRAIVVVPGPSALDTSFSSFREKMLEHVFVSELLQEAWFRHGRTIEVLRAEVDSEGYDLVVEFNGVLRHIQLKSSRSTAKTATQNLSIKLGKKQSGCVVWIVYHEEPKRARIGLTYRFFGGDPGEPLPPLGNTIAKHAKGDAKGVKKEKPGFRVVNKGAFTPELPIEELFARLFLRGA